MNENHHDRLPIPTGDRISRPSWRSILESWTGRILILNTFVFVAMTFEGSSIMLPPEDILIRYGAKSTYHLIQGEFWRYFTPMFVHIGLIHFGLNSLALYYVGSHIEQLVGGKWFLIIYLLSGLGGGVASAVFTFGLSAGASGAIFGLLGVGFVFERFIHAKVKRATGEKMRQGPYTGLVVANVILGFILTTGPIRIDNGAHLGGLFTGVLMGLALLWTIPNKLAPQAAHRARLIYAGLAALMLVSAYLGMSAQFAQTKIGYLTAAKNSPQERYDALSEAIKVFPNKPEYRYDRGVLLLYDGAIQQAEEDLDRLVKVPEYYLRLNKLADDLRAQSRVKEYVAVKKILQKFDQSLD